MTAAFSAPLLLFATALALAAALRLLLRLNDIRHFRRMDPVTGLPARTRFEEKLTRRLAKPDAVAALIGADLSNLRNITQTYGWEAGDGVLRELASRMAGLGGRKGMAARLGGTDFALLLPGLTDPLKANEMARTLLAELERPVEWKGHALSLRTSLGIAMLPRDGKDSASLLRALASALAAAKQAGPGTIRFHDPRVEEAAAARARTEALIRESLENGHFKLALQPVFEVKTRQLHGFEALIRLNHPQHGMISPALFIPVAEETGLIHELGRFTLQEACRIAHGWPDGYKIAVNLSPVQFRSGNLIGMVRSLLEEMRFPAYRLELEVTEGLILEDTDYVKAQLKSLEEMGVRLVLDDFGTGYSSLSYLWQFPFRKLKIDQSFLRNMDDNPQVLGIISAIMALARSLGLPVTAEGVEREDQMSLLRQLGCQEAQGFHLGRPMPEADAHALVQADMARRAQPASAEEETAIAV